MKRLHKILNASIDINFGWFGFLLFLTSIIAVPLGITLLLIRWL